MGPLASRRAGSRAGRGVLAGDARPTAARRELEIGELLDRPLEVRGAGAPGIGDQPVGGAEGILSRRLTCAADSPASSATATSWAVRTRLLIQYRRPGRRSPASAGSGRRAWRRASPPRIASASDQALCSADGAVSSSTISASTRAPSPAYSASFSSSRSSRCCRSPTCAISARAVSGLDLQAELARLRDHPLGQLRRLDALLGADVAARLPHRRVQALLGGLGAAVLAREESPTVVSSRDDLEHWPRGGRTACRSTARRPRR